MPAVETKSVSVAPFGIEADHPRNCDLLLQGIVGMRLRSAIDASKPAKDHNTGESYVPPDQSAFLGQFPHIPGMQLHVNPAKLTYLVTDPLHEDEDLCERIKNIMARVTSTRIDGKLKGVADQEGKLDAHRMKTLVREMRWLVTAGEARVVKGVLPEMDAIDELPGNFLLNPGARTQTTQPTFEKDWDAWFDRLTRSGG